MKIRLLILLLTLSVLAKSQEGNNIVFGYKFGLNFSATNPSVFQTIDAPWSSSACYSDIQGKLKFYVNRDNIFNWKKNKIDGNDSMLCLRSYSSFGCSYFIKDLLDTNNIILFSTYLKRDWQPLDTPYYQLRNKESGLYLNIINKNSNNGEGKLVTQNKIVYKGFVDKLEIIRNKNEVDYWIIVQSDSNTFAVFNYSKLGLSTPTYFTFNNFPLLYGSLKASNSGDALLYTGTSWSLFSDSTHLKVTNTCNLLNFNNQTGEITNGKTIDSFTSNTDVFKKEGASYFFSCFSPNDSLIYLTDYFAKGAIGGGYKNTVFQFDRFNINPSITKIFIDPLLTNVSRLGKMILAPNGKIYFGIVQFCDTCYTDLYIPSIEKPNYPGLGCKFNAKSVAISRYNYMFPSDVFYEYLKVSFISEKQNCNTVKFTKECHKKFTKFQWFFDDGDSAIGDAISHTFTKSGLHNIKLKSTTAGGYIVWYAEDLYITLPPKANFTTISNQGCQYVAINFTNKSYTDSAKLYKYTWLFGDGTKLSQTSSLNLLNDTIEHVYTSSGIFTVKLIFDNGFCIDTFKITNTVNVIPAPDPDFSLSTHRGCTPTFATLKANKNNSISKREIDFGKGFYTSIDTNIAIDTLLYFNNKGTYILKQRLTGITGCITYFEDTLIIYDGVNNNAPPKILTASFTNDSNIIISWLPVVNCVKYNLFKDRKLLVTTRSLSFNDIVNLSQFSKLNSEYVIQAIDTCGNSTSYSNIARPIILSADIKDNTLGIVRWSPYEKWDDGVNEYELQFRIGKTSTWSPLLNLNNNTFSVNHNLLESYQSNSSTQIEICYQVIAIENQGNFQFSSSNTACIYLRPTVFIPNSFSPNNDGINDVFFPIGVGIDDYEIFIYDRWGELIYNGIEKDNGWNGKLKNGTIAPEGTYVYIVQSHNLLQTNIKKEFNLRGTVNLIR